MSEVKTIKCGSHYNILQIYQTSLFLGLSLELGVAMCYALALEIRVEEVCRFQEEAVRVNACFSTFSSSPNFRVWQYCKDYAFLSEDSGAFAQTKMNSV
jgi:hypothetical protein